MGNELGEYYSQVNRARDFCKVVRRELHALLASAADAVKWYGCGGPTQNKHFTAHFTQ
jgi:hypothetical protein